MESLDLKTIIGLLVSVVLAVFGYLYRYYDDKKNRKRLAHLSFITKQLEEFYGPLFFRSVSGEKSYQELLKKLGKPQISLNPTKKELKEWRIWYKTVFHPVNLEMENIILEKSFLIREEVIPQPLTDYISHISPYKAILAKWEEKDFSEHFSTVDFPKDFTTYIHRSYHALKKEQIRLMNS